MWHSLVLFFIPQTLFKLALLLSLRQYNVRRNHLHNNPQAKMPNSAGYFYEIKHTALQAVGNLPHSHPHSTRYQRKMAAANVWRHSRRRRHSGVCGLRALPIRDSPIKGSPRVGWYPEVSCHLLLLWHGHQKPWLQVITQRHSKTRNLLLDKQSCRLVKQNGGMNCIWTHKGIATWVLIKCQNPWEERYFLQQTDGAGKTRCP